MKYLRDPHSVPESALPENWRWSAGPTEDKERILPPWGGEAILCWKTRTVTVGASVEFFNEGRSGKRKMVDAAIRMLMNSQR